MKPSDEEVMYFLNLVQGNPQWSEEEAEYIQRGEITQEMQNKIFANNPVLAGLAQGMSLDERKQLLDEQKFEWQKVVEGRELDIDEAELRKDIRRNEYLNMETQTRVNQMSEEVLKNKLTQEEWKTYTGVKSEIQGVLKGIAEQVREMDGNSDNYITLIAEEMERSQNFAETYNKYIQLKANALGVSAVPVPVKGTKKGFVNWLRKVFTAHQPEMFNETVFMLSSKGGQGGQPQQPTSSSDAVSDKALADDALREAGIE